MIKYNDNEGKELDTPQQNQSEAIVGKGISDMTNQGANTPPTDDNTIKAAGETPSSIVKGKAATATDAVDADADVNKTILDGFLKERERLANEKAQIESQNPNTPEAIKKTRRRALIASIADGLSALSGMYFATKGAPATNNVVPGITEGIAKQNTTDRNTYIELLQNWRKRNNELINNYATYQAAAERNRIAAANASLEVEREARLLAKQDWQKVYQTTLLELKAKKIDDDKAKWEAKLAADKAEAESLDRYRKQLVAIGWAKVGKSGQDSTEVTEWTYDKGKPQSKKVTTTYNNGSK